MKKFLCFLPLFVAFGGVHSAAGLCTGLNVNVKNNTAETCTLTESITARGLLDNISIPKSISSNSSVSFFVHQYHCYGPELHLTYQCGPTEYVSIKSQQNFSFFSAGDVTATVLKQSEHINAKSAVKNGACKVFSRGEDGVIDWSINNR